MSSSTRRITLVIGAAIGLGAAAPALTQNCESGPASATIAPTVDRRLTTLLYGTNAPSFGEVDIEISGHLSATAGRVRIFGRISMSYPHARTRYQDTFERTVYDVQQGRPGCVVDTTAGDCREGRRAFSIRERVSSPFVILPQATGWETRVPGLNHAVCTTWVPGSQTGQIGCTLVFNPFQMVLRRQADLGHCRADTRIDLPQNTQVRASAVERGDPVLAGPTVYVNAEANVETFEGRILLREDVALSESGGDRSRLSGSKTTVVYDVARDAPGCRLATPLSGLRAERAVVVWASTDLEDFRVRVLESANPLSYGWWLGRCSAVGFKGCYDLDWLFTGFLPTTRVWVDLAPE